MIFDIQQSALTNETIFVETTPYTATILEDLMISCGFKNFYVACLGAYENAIVFTE